MKSKLSVLRIIRILSVIMVIYTVLDLFSGNSEVLIPGLSTLCIGLYMFSLFIEYKITRPADVTSFNQYSLVGVGTCSLMASIVIFLNF